MTLQEDKENRHRRHCYHEAGGNGGLEECIWLSEWESLEELEVEASRCIEHYNVERTHSALGYLTPMEVHRLAIGEKTSLQIAA